MNKEEKYKKAINELADSYELHLKQWAKRCIDTINEYTTNLQQENKILKENAENNDKVVDKVNWENMLLKKENKQLKDNWNKLKECLKDVMNSSEADDKEFVETILDIMQELEAKK